MFSSTVFSVIKICLEAGREILNVYESADIEVEAKADDSPLTKADRKSHEVIAEGLKNIKIDDKELPLLSEEGRNIPYITRKNWNKFWLVDPLDGTKEFIKRNGEFTVNIALIEGQNVFGGVVYVPVKKILYIGWKDTGSYKIENIDVENIPETVKKAKRLENKQQYSNRVNVVASRSHLSPETEGYIEGLKKRFDDVQTVSSGSSIKLCMVAEGSADVYPRFAPTMEWDTAAAQGVCSYAGVRVIDVETKDIMKYNRENQLNNWFLVSSNKVFEEML